MNFYKILTIPLISLFFTSPASADIRSEFPSYSYVLTEFDVDERFIDNPEFKNFVHKNKREYRKRYIDAVKRGGLIIPTIKEMMYQQDISPVFLYIAMVESAFKPEARSRTGAGGLWQFTVNTGSKEFNLHVGRDLDERYDPIRSTDSAIKYLYKMNNNLNSWYLTTMAYNCGNGCVNRSLRKAGTKDLGTLISSRHGHIKAETRKYIQKVLLMAMIGENYLFRSDDNLGAMMYSINKDSITPVKVRSGDSLARISKVLNMDMFYLKKINAHLKNGKVPYRHGYTVNIPTSKVRMFNARYASSFRPSTINQYNLYAQR
ncbi:MAG: Membrane-bound lytic murein transglycosylase D [uncultured Sulfurovum sp.]|uniref:Membrane-bound lytic murein transglycosylase D n=1 Tax=uncultured Sulfurovum sp. TaxID=269237 RepID=A0A6S6SJK4_9BACT|nr:MAG: Membrane-bound lytic murein transglycosylase D [uncultured Sulfurovum sp.]